MNAIRKERRRVVGFGDDGPKMTWLPAFFGVCPDCGAEVRRGRAGGGSLGPKRASFTRDGFDTRKQAKDAVYRHHKQQHNSGSGEVRGADVA